MTIKEFSTYFRKELAFIYPDPEIESLRRILFRNLLAYKHPDLYFRAAETIPDHMLSQMYICIEQLKRNRPIQYILGVTEFYGLSFYVNEKVLIPRPETEELVHWVLEEQTNLQGRILDIGTGSGCIAVTLAKMLPNAKVCGIDISDDVLKIAKKNANNHGVEIDFQKADILTEPFPELGTFEIIVSNPPYVTHLQKNRMKANVLDYEPYMALFVPEADPLIFYRAIARFANTALSRGGCMYFEINEDLSQETANYLSESGFNTELRKDINNKFRMIKATFS